MGIFTLGNTTGAGNTAVGASALDANAIGDGNTGLGESALRENTTGDYNTATGSYAMSYNTTGDYNTAVGNIALSYNTTGSHNTAIGSSALLRNETGSFNTASGVGALAANTTGKYNTAVGYDSLNNNTTASYNTAAGVQALFSNTTGIDNTATGNYSLYSNSSGFNNTADGLNALFLNTTGSNNMASGFSALSLNTTGLNNTAEGSQALLRNTTGSRNVALGFQAGQNLTTGSDNIDIGNGGVAGEAAKIRIGTTGTHKDTYVAGIFGVTATRGVSVYIDSAGHLGTTTSSARFKDAIKPMDKVSEAILALQPVTFHYKNELDPDGIPQFGLVAEQVEKVNPDLVARDEQGKPYTVRYEAVNAMLLNEFLKEHRRFEEQAGKVKQQETAIAEQQKAIIALTRTLREQALQLQKVSARLAAAEQSAPRVVSNDQSKTTR